MTRLIDPTIDRSSWGAGPWDAEPDRAEWEHAGLPCLAIRNHYGSWCGYAAVAPGHPLHGKSYEDSDVSVHGGLTYADACSHRDDGLAGICHVPKPGEPDDVWWFGFDCAHCDDLAPAMHSRRDRAREATYGLTLVYRTLAYVQAETNALAEQLVALGTSR